MKLNVEKVVAAAVGAAVAVAFVAEAQSVARPADCMSGAQIVAQENLWCANMGIETSTGSVGTCCGTGSVADIMYSSNGGCRSVETDSPYCIPGTECEENLGENDDLTIALDLQPLGDEDVCCRECTCFGDPNCISFEGVRDEWIPCDGRLADNCRMKKSVCRNSTGPGGHQCKWLKRSDEWVSFEESGSPCQPDFAREGYPTMNMYSVGDSFSLQLVLGERGVIKQVDLKTSDGTFALNAATCFEYDPREGKDALDAWTGDAVPSSWTATTPNELEIWHGIDDRALGLHVDIVCTKNFVPSNFNGTARPRLNVHRLIDAEDSRDGESGFCSDDIILDKTGSHTERTSSIQQDCLDENIPGLLETCKALMSSQCTYYQLDNRITEWCAKADLARSLMVNEDSCVVSLTKGTQAERNIKWTEAVCMINRLNVVSCKQDISQFGWDTFLATRSDGMIDDGNAIQSCTSDASLYGVDTSTCTQGVAVEYLQDEEWKQSFFIPNSMPPCNNEIVVNAVNHPELFLHPIRISQCDQSSICTLANECEANGGFSTSFLFSSTDCPTASPTTSPTTAAPTDSPTVSPTTLAPTDSPTVSPTTLAPTDSPTVSPTTLAPTDSPTPEPTEPTSSPTPTDERRTPAPTPTDGTPAPTPTDGTPAPTPTDGTPAPTPTDGTPAPTPTDGTPAPTPTDGTPAPTPTDGTPAPTPTDGTPAPTPTDGTPVPTPTDGTPAPTPTDGTPAPTPTDGTPAPTPTDSTPAPTPTEGTGSPTVGREQPECETDCRFETELSPEICVVEVVELGSCEACCVAPTFLPEPGQEMQCRDVRTSEPYCDETTNPECEDLDNKDFELTISFSFEDEEIECCQTCMCYGDPFCENFYGVADKWILCDSRKVDDCYVNKDVCLTQADHAGNACIWNETTFNKFSRRADIGVYGSPCVPDFHESGPANLVMYSIPDLTVTIGMGERAVIEDVQLETQSGLFTLVADNCFEEGPYPGFTGPEGTPIQSMFAVDLSDGPGPNERGVKIRHLETGIFLTITCIRRVKDGEVGYRMNVNSLIEVDINRQDADGFCETGELPKGASTTDVTEEVFEECLQNLDDAHLLCRALVNPACTETQVEEGVEEWCAVANLYPDNPNRIAKCTNEILGSGNRSPNKIASKWIEQYCISVEGNREVGTSSKNFRKVCKSMMQNNGYESSVAVYGNGQIGALGYAGATCAQSASQYGPRTPGMECLPGLSVEAFVGPGPDDWEEILFMPNNLRPCDGQIRVTGEQYPQLFKHPIRINECTVSPSCAIDVLCLPNLGYNVTISFSHDGSLCPASSVEGAQSREGIPNNAFRHINNIGILAAITLLLMLF